MPYINTTVNVPITEQAERELKEFYGKAITLIKGKTENWLMLNFRGNEHIYFAGSDAPAAMVEIHIFGAATEKEYDSLTAAVCKAISEKLGVSPDRIYVKYGEYEHWGWNNINF